MEDTLATAGAGAVGVTLAEEYILEYVRRVLTGMCFIL